MRSGHRSSCLASPSFLVGSYLDALVRWFFTGASHIRQTPKIKREAHNEALHFASVYSKNGWTVPIHPFQLLTSYNTAQSQ